METYNFKVAYPDTTVHIAAGLGRTAHLPRIFDSRPGMHLEGSLYIIERGLGEWVPASPGKQGPALGRKTNNNYARWLANFLEWSEARGIDPLNADYQTVLRYQTELVKGIFCRDGVPLSPTTINLYVDIAIDYIRWLTAKGLRTPMNVPTVSTTYRTNSATSSVGHRARSTTGRIGKIRKNPRRLQRPTLEAVDAWLSSLYAASETFGLMADLVLLAGPRREEVAAWRVDTLPVNPNDWVVANPHAHPAEHEILLVLKYGTKGDDYGEDNGDKIGPERHIKIPLHLACRLHHYRTHLRNELLVPYVRKGKGLKEQVARAASVHLFRDHDGERVKGKRFYDAWKAGDLPFAEWSPHLGRHWWACSVLWMHYQRHVSNMAATDKPSSEALFNWAENTIRFHIQPFLGHAQLDTSLIYLNWFSDMISVSLPERFQSQVLEDDEL